MNKMTHRPARELNMQDFQLRTCNIRWRLYIEEYSPDRHYIKGTHNLVADALSCLDISHETLTDTTSTFLGLMDCFIKSQTTREIVDFQLLNYQQLQRVHLSIRL